MRKSICCICLLIILGAFSFCQAGEKTASLYPLEKGSYWIYKGNIKWTPEGSGQKVKSRSLTWKMSTHDVMESDKYRVALVTGFPGDVAWYEEGMTPQYSLLVQDDKRIYWNDYKTVDEAMDAAKAIKAGTRNSIDSLRCIIEFPLTKGKKYDVTDDSRPDTMYAWYVEAVDKVNLKIKGYSNKKPVTRFRLIYRTQPDHIIMEFVPGLGITRYVYDHHGTVAFEDLRLVEYGRKQ